MLGDLNHPKFDIFQHQLGSNEARLKAAVEMFLLGEGDYQPTWRRVTHSLNQADERLIASKILAYAEAVQGELI